MKNLKITIIGNSVAIRNRPPQKYPANKNYGVFLEELLQSEYSDMFVNVRNMAFSRATILNVVERLDDFIASMPNYYIINIGVSDASSREIPYWMAEIINNPKITFLKSIYSGLHHHFIKPNRSFFVRLRGKRSWISQTVFKNNLISLIQLLHKETNSKIIFIPINPTNERVEKEVPGSSENYNKFNEIIKYIAKKHGCLMIDINDLEPSVHFPDGIHYSSEGNSIIAKKLFETIVRDMKDA